MERQSALVRRGGEAESRGNVRIAERFYKEALAMRGGFFVHFQLAHLYDKAGRKREAIREYRTAFHGDGRSWSSMQDDPGLLARYGDLSMEKGDSHEARWAYSIAARRGGNYVGTTEPTTKPHGNSVAALRSAAHTAAGLKLGAQGDHKGLLRELQLAVRSDGAYWVPRFYRARLYARMGRMEAAATDSRLAERLAPEAQKEKVRDMRQENGILG